MVSEQVGPSGQVFICYLFLSTRHVCEKLLVLSCFSNRLRAVFKQVKEKLMLLYVTAGVKSWFSESLVTRVQAISKLCCSRN